MAKEQTSSYAEYLREQNATDDLYSAFQKRTGLSDAEFWCIFSVYNGSCVYQHEISRHMFMNKQTVNSALKQLVKRGLIEMLIPPENQRLRKVVLTERGREFSHQYLDYIDKLGQNAWASLSTEEQSAILSGIRKFNGILSIALQSK